MTITRRAFALSVLLLVCGVAASARQETAAPAKASLSAEQMEQFLLKARLFSIRSAGDGITDSRRATFTDGSLTTTCTFRPSTNTARSYRRCKARRSTSKTATGITSAGIVSRGCSAWTTSPCLLSAALREPRRR